MHSLPAAQLSQRANAADLNVVASNKPAPGGDNCGLIGLGQGAVVPGGADVCDTGDSRLRLTSQFLSGGAALPFAARPLFRPKLRRCGDLMFL